MLTQIPDSEISDFVNIYGVNFTGSQDNTFRLNLKVKGINTQLKVSLAKNILQVIQIYVLSLPVKFAALGTAMSEIQSHLDTLGLGFSAKGDTIILGKTQVGYSLDNLEYSNGSLTIATSF